ncbi:MAG: HesA/MoeB/ThiF family protein [Desulfurococcaceae archaeon]
MGYESVENCIATQSLTPEEVTRYSRQVALIGCKGQEKLKNTRVLVAGAGGLGSAILYYLVAAGVGHITVIDDGTIDLSDLQRQVLYTSSDLGLPKVNVAARRLRDLNPFAEIRPVYTTITEDVLDKIVPDIDIIMDALDNMETRFILDKVAWRHNKPLIHGGVEEYYGQVTVIIPGKTPCLRCLFREIRGDIRGGRIIRVMAHIPGIIGLLEVNELFKLVLGYGEPLVNKILLFNARTPAIEMIEIKGFDCKDICSS